ncbi:MAG: hypothetical protein ACFFAS_18490 [Promethearchaeota archaeon]
MIFLHDLVNPGLFRTSTGAFIYVDVNAEHNLIKSISEHHFSQRDGGHRISPELYCYFLSVLAFRTKSKFHKGNLKIT